MRMLRQIFAILLLAVGVCLGAAQAQQAPDDEDIFARTLDEASPYYYPSLIMRYRAGDTTLTATDYYYLYYGYAFSENYRPLRPIKAEDDMLAVLERINQDSIRYEDMEAVIRCADEVMQSDPFSPRNLNFLVYAYGTIGDTLNERINYDRLTKVLATISVSGTGRSEKSPLHVLRFEHASDWLAARGKTVLKRLVVSRSAEYVTVANEQGRPESKGYYFDFSRVFRHPEEMPKQKQRWQINDIPLEKNQ